MFRRYKFYCIHGLKISNLETLQIGINPAIKIILQVQIKSVHINTSKFPGFLTEFRRHTHFVTTCFLVPLGHQSVNTLIKNPPK